MRITQIIITAVALIIAGEHLKWPNLKIDSITLTLLLVAVMPWLSQIFKSLELPGGWKIEFHDLQKATKRADEAGLLSGKVQSASPYSFQLVADEDPNLALAGLRIEIEKRLTQIAESYQIDSGRSSAGRLTAYAREARSFESPRTIGVSRYGGIAQWCGAWRKD